MAKTPNTTATATTATVASVVEALGRVRRWVQVLDQTGDPREAPLRPEDIRTLLHEYTHVRDSCATLQDRVDGAEVALDELHAEREGARATAALLEQQLEDVAGLFGSMLDMTVLPSNPVAVHYRDRLNLIMRPYLTPSCPCAVCAPADAFLIWSHEHNAWWGPAFRGYTGEPGEAGRYSEHVAGTVCENAAYLWLRGEIAPYGDVPPEVAVPAPDPDEPLALSVMAARVREVTAAAIAARDQAAAEPAAQTAAAHAPDGSDG